MGRLDPILGQWVSTYRGSKEEFTKLLGNVDETHARARPIGGRHTIWEIVNHCTFWVEAAISAINGLEMPARGEDWPPTGEGEEEWRADAEKFNLAIDRLVEAVSNFNLDGIHDDVPGKHYPYSYFQMFFRVAHHNIHHGGQIAILRPKE